VLVANDSNTTIRQNDVIQAGPPKLNILPSLEADRLSTIFERIFLFII
jgi:hypothetical protein